MRQTLITLFAMAALRLCMSASAVEEEQDSEALSKAVAQRRAEIKAELATGSAAEWAGEYGFGDGLGVNVHLSLAPNRGFAYRWTGLISVAGR